MPVSLGGVLEDELGVGLGCMSVSGQYDNGVPMPEDEATAFFKGAGANALRTVGSALVLVLYGEIKQAMAVRPRPAIRCLVRPPRSHRQ